MLNVHFVHWTSRRKNEHINKQTGIILHKDRKLACDSETFNYNGATVTYNWIEFKHFLNETLVTYTFCIEKVPSDSISWAKSPEKVIYLITIDLN